MTVAKFLTDLAEALETCAGGCRIVGLQPTFDYKTARFAVFPKNPTDEQRAWALRVTSGLLRDDQPNNPVPVIYFYWEKHQTCAHFDSGSLNWLIVRAEFSVADTLFPHQHPIKWKLFSCFEPGLTDLGELQP